jgi:hypothetical protein
MCQVQAPPPSYQETLRTPPRRRLWKFAWSGGGALATLIGLWIGFVELAPAINVSVASSLAADDPYEPRFTVTNVGYLTVYRLVFGCWVTMPIQPKVPGPLDFGLGIKNRSNGEAGNNLAAEAVLAPQDSVVKTCTIKVANNTPGNISLVGAIIDFFITYRPFASVFRERRAVRFTSRNDPSAGIVWIPAPYSEKWPPPPPSRFP